ncbi:MAG: hypothetical protein ABIG43_05090 [Chloroflexota bacterium]
MSFFRGRQNSPRFSRPRLKQAQASSWDVVVLAFKLLFSRVQFWIQPNFWTVIFSLGLVTAPGAKAALHHTTAAGLRDPAGSEVNALKEMKTGFKCYLWRALLLSIIKWFFFAVIALSIYFWVSQDTWALRAVSIISIYGLVLWWLSSGYIYPIFVDNPKQPVFQVLKQAMLLAFKKPFPSLLFAVVSTLLMILGIALLGPVMLIIPVLRAILMLQGYWFLTGREIPGFMEIFEYANKHYDMKS